MSSYDIGTLEEEIANLEQSLLKKKIQLQELKNNISHCPYSNIFSTKEITRYSRQMIMPQISINGQLALKKSKVLVVGAGGLGCPASLYLSAAGVGEIHIMDYDEVELSNIHRQILHYETDVGVPKVQSVRDKLTKINNNIKVVPLHMHASQSIVEEIIKNKYSVVLDCSDNAPTRYLLNDVCVLYNIPLVSGSALQMEGQLTVYNYNNGPCYRCLFPVPPPAHTVTNCGDGGVLGPVAGVIGVLQALEAIKIITKMDGVLSKRLLLFDGVDSTFRNIKLRKKVACCDVCGDNPTIISPVDYEQFCGSQAHDKVMNIDVLENDDHVDAKQLPDLLNGDYVVLDVRPELEYAMCKLPNTINFPYSKIKSKQATVELEEIMKKVHAKKSNVYVLCRRGNDSQRFVDYLKEVFPAMKFLNIRGGLHAYSKLVDSSFPVY